MRLEEEYSQQRNPLNARARELLPQTSCLTVVACRPLPGGPKTAGVELRYPPSQICNDFPEPVFANGV
jgi:hypothetical protein